jgi:predicted transcriptional regulator
MAHKISIYVKPELHRELKALASRSGLSLSELMVRAAMQYLHAPDRAAVAKRMDEIRNRIAESSEPFRPQEIREMREEGKKY